MPKGLKMILLRTLTNIAAQEKSEAIFNKEENKVISRLLKITKALKEDRASSYACLMLFYNLIMLLEKTSSELKNLKKEVITLFLDILKNENDEKNQLSLIMNLMWLIYDNAGLKQFSKETTDNMKLIKLEASENATLRMATQDYIALIENKL